MRLPHNLRYSQKEGQSASLVERSRTEKSVDFKLTNHASEIKRGVAESESKDDDLARLKASLENVKVAEEESAAPQASF